MNDAVTPELLALYPALAALPALLPGLLLVGLYLGFIVFKAITDPVARAKTAIERRLTDYLRDKEARARREREEQERLAREAAETARREAEARAWALADEQGLQAAIAAEKAA